MTFSRTDRSARSTQVAAKRRRASAKLLDAVYANVWDEVGGWLPMDVESAGL